MKKLFTLILAGVMAFSMAACGGKTTEEPTRPEVSIPAEMESMKAPIDALARCILENDLLYDVQDPEFFWTALYYFVGGYGLDHPLVEEEENSYQLKVPTPVMQEHATVLFADYSDLLPMPSIMKGNVSYDYGWDAYFLSRGDIGLSEIRLTSYEETMRGYVVTAELWGIGPEEELIATYEVTMMDSAYIDGITDPLYLYSIVDIMMLPDDVPDSLEGTIPTEKTSAIFNGLADSHTVELTLPDGSVQPFQFDTESDAANIMASLNEGDGITVYYYEAANGGLMIAGIE